MPQVTCPKCLATAELLTSFDHLKGGFNFSMGVDRAIIAKCLNPQKSDDPADFDCPDLRTTAWEAIPDE